MRSVTVVLTGPQVGYARSRYTPARQRNKVAELQQAAERKMNGESLLEGPLCVDFLVEFEIPRSWSKKKQVLMMGAPAPRKPDYDNLMKLVTDAFNKVVYRDDAHVTDVAFLKRYGLQPKIVITVSEIAATPRRIDKP
jgi:Holliday junction resolvase RusA-like endonuclease